LPRVSVSIMLLSLAFVVALMPMLSVLIFKPGKTPTFSVFNKDWDGCSKFKEMLEERGYKVKVVVSSLSVANKLNKNCVIVIIGPSKMYTPDDGIFGIIPFIINGGGVLIADDFGSANSLLLQTFPEVSFYGYLLMDAGSYDKNPVLPIIRNFLPHPIFEDVHEILFNYPSAIKMALTNTTGGGVFQVVAMSSRYSWLDVDMDHQPYGILNGTDIPGPLPVVAVAEIGRGRVVLISDPSVFINDMITRRDNAVFALNVIKWLAHGKTNVTIIFDESHLNWEGFSDVTVCGLFLKPLIWFTSTPYLALIFPVIASVFALRVLRRRGIKIKRPTFRRRGKFGSFVAKLHIYERYGMYREALRTLYEYFRKEASKILKVQDLKEEYLLDFLSRKVDPQTLRKIREALRGIRDVLRGRRQIGREDFLKYYFDIKFLDELVRKVG